MASDMEDFAGLGRLVHEMVAGKGDGRRGMEGPRLKGFDLQGNYFNPETVAGLVKSAPPGCMLAVSAGSGSTMA